MKKTILLIFITGILVLAACTTKDINEPNNIKKDLSQTDNTSNEIKTKNIIKDISWLDYTLKDINTGTNFKISDYKNKNNVILETFAVWCVNCKQQQDQIKKFHKTHPEVLSISVNADPNESEESVLKYINKNGYDWRYVIASENFMNLLLDEFGIVIANAPAAPIVLICKDQSYTLLPAGIKSAKELSEAVEMSC